MSHTSHHQMSRTSHDPRTGDTKDLSVSLRANERPSVVGRVLNLSGGGMLVAISSDLDIGRFADFELSGPAFCFAGRAEIAHREDRAMGLRFVSWDGPVGRSVHDLVVARLRRQQAGVHHAVTMGIRREAVWNSRKHDRVALSGLSAVIERSHRGTTRRLPVFNVSEHGMLIDGLGLALGARFSFDLAARGINHVGRGRVAHRTGTIAGVAIYHWYGAPEAICALISGEAALGLPPADAYVTDWSRTATPRCTPGERCARRGTDDRPVCERTGRCRRRGRVLSPCGYADRHDCGIAWLRT
jgi:hypothetical protein